MAEKALDQRPSREFGDILDGFPADFRDNLPWDPRQPYLALYFTQASYCSWYAFGIFFMARTNSCMQLEGM